MSVERLQEETTEPDAPTERRHVWPGGARRMVSFLVAAAVVAHALDLVTGVTMMREVGLRAELNPFARALFANGGALTLGLVKAGVVLIGITLLVRLNRYGHTRLSLVSLFIALALGWAGFISNVNVLNAVG